MYICTHSKSTFNVSQDNNCTLNVFRVITALLLLYSTLCFFDAWLQLDIKWHNYHITNLKGNFGSRKIWWIQHMNIFSTIKFGKLVKLVCTTAHLHIFITQKNIQSYCNLWTKGVKPAQWCMWNLWFRGGYYCSKKKVAIHIMIFVYKSQKALNTLQWLLATISKHSAARVP